MAETKPATKPTAAKPASASSSPKKSSGKKKLLIVLLILALPVLAVFIRLTLLFILAGMMPTIVAYLVDRTDGKKIFQSVMACNLAGILPYAVKLIHAGNPPSLVGQQIHDPFVWLVILSSAGIGWCMVWFWPYLAFLLIKTMAVKETFRLDMQQRSLTEEWGPEIKRKE